VHSAVGLPQPEQTSSSTGSSFGVHPQESHIFPPFQKSYPNIDLTILRIKKRKQVFRSEILRDSKAIHLPVPLFPIAQRSFLSLSRYSPPPHPALSTTFASNTWNVYQDSVICKGKMLQMQDFLIPRFCLHF